MRSFFQIFFALITLSALVWVSWQGYLLLRTRQLNLDASTQSLLIIIAVLVIICTFIITSSITSASHRIARAQLFAKKFVLYENMLNRWKDTSPDTSAYPAGESVENVFLGTQLSLLASTQVVKIWNEYMDAYRSGKDSKRTLNAREKLLTAIRSDLGLSNDYFLLKELKKMQNQ